MISNANKIYFVALFKSVARAEEASCVGFRHYQSYLDTHDNFKDWCKDFVGKDYLQVFGKIVIAVPPQYSSQECSFCHQIVKKSLSTRTHVCECGCILDRDENASRNLLAKGLELLSRGGQSRINAQGHLNLCSMSESLLNKFGG